MCSTILPYARPCPDRRHAPWRVHLGAYCLVRSAHLSGMHVTIISTAPTLPHTPMHPSLTHAVCGGNNCPSTPPPPPHFSCLPYTYDMQPLPTAESRIKVRPPLPPHTCHADAVCGREAHHDPRRRNLWLHLSRGLPGGLGRACKAKPDLLECLQVRGGGQLWLHLSRGLPTQPAGMP